MQEEFKKVKILEKKEKRIKKQKLSIPFNNIYNKTDSDNNCL